MMNWRILSLFSGLICLTQAFCPPSFGPSRTAIRSYMSSNDGMAGSFFNQVPENDDDNKGDAPSKSDDGDGMFDFDESVNELLRRRKAPPKASIPSTIGGVPTSKAVGFGKQKASKPPAPKKPYVGLGAPDKPVNDINNPEYDDQGYTVYTNEETGEKKRVFEALVEYPCDFTMKIVGANEGTFVTDVVQVVAESCKVQADNIKFTTRVMGKWTSVTVKAPVKSAEMLYILYENIDRDPRVKFKF